MAEQESLRLVGAVQRTSSAASPEYRSRSCSQICDRSRSRTRLREQSSIPLPPSRTRGFGAATAERARRHKRVQRHSRIPMPLRPQLLRSYTSHAPYSFPSRAVTMRSNMGSRTRSVSPQARLQGSAQAQRESEIQAGLDRVFSMMPAKASAQQPRAASPLRGSSEAAPAAAPAPLPTPFAGDARSAPSARAASAVQPSLSEVMGDSAPAHVGSNGRLSVAQVHNGGIAVTSSQGALTTAPVALQRGRASTAQAEQARAMQPRHRSVDGSASQTEPVLLEAASSISFFPHLPTQHIIDAGFVRKLAPSDSRADRSSLMQRGNAQLPPAHDAATFAATHAHLQRAQFAPAPAASIAGVTEAAADAELAQMQAQHASALLGQHASSLRSSSAGLSTAMQPRRSAFDENQVEGQSKEGSIRDLGVPGAVWRNIVHSPMVRERASASCTAQLDDGQAEKHLGSASCNTSAPLLDAQPPAPCVLGLDRQCELHAMPAGYDTPGAASFARQSSAGSAAPMNGQQGSALDSTPSPAVAASVMSEEQPAQRDQAAVQVRPDPADWQAHASAPGAAAVSTDSAAIPASGEVQLGSEHRPPSATTVVRNGAGGSFRQHSSSGTGAGHLVCCSNKLQRFGGSQRSGSGRQAITSAEDLRSSTEDHSQAQQREPFAASKADTLSGRPAEQVCGRGRYMPSQQAADECIPALVAGREPDTPVAAPAEDCDGARATQVADVHNKLISNAPKSGQQLQDSSIAASSANQHARSREAPLQSRAGQTAAAESSHAAASSFCTGAVHHTPSDVGNNAEPGRSTKAEGVWERAAQDAGVAVQDGGSQTTAKAADNLQVDGNFVDSRCHAAAGQCDVGNIATPQDTRVHAPGSAASRSPAAALCCSHGTSAPCLDDLTAVDGIDLMPCFCTVRAEQQARKHQQQSAQDLTVASWTGDCSSAHQLRCVDHNERARTACKASTGEHPDRQCAWYAYIAILEL